MRFGVSRRQVCVQAAAAPCTPGPQRPPTQRVQQVLPRQGFQGSALVPQKSYLEAVKAAGPQTLPPPQQHMQQHNYHQLHKPPPQQQQQGQRQQAQHKQREPLSAPPAATAAAPASAAVQSPVTLTPVLPVGPLQRAQPAVGPPLADSEETILRKNIFSADEEAQMEAEDAWIDEDTIQELDEDVTDPNRVYARMGKGKKRLCVARNALTKASSNCANSNRLWKRRKPCWQPD